MRTVLTMLTMSTNKRLCVGDPLFLMCASAVVRGRQRDDSLKHLKGRGLRSVPDDQPARARLVLLGAVSDAQNLPITLTVHPDRHQRRHVADLAGPAALEHDAVQVVVGMLAFDRPVAPRLDRAVELLVQV